MACLKRIISGFLAITIIFSLSVSALAFDVGMAIEGLGVIGTFADVAINLYDRWKEAHPNTPDSEYPGFNPGGIYGGGVGRDELNQKYDDYVQTLPATGYDSSGGLLWSPKTIYIRFNTSISGKTWYYCPHYPGGKINSTGVDFTFDCQNKYFSVRPVSGSHEFYIIDIELSFDEPFPMDGFYKRIVSPAFQQTAVDANSVPRSGEVFYTADSSAFYCNSGESFLRSASFKAEGGNRFKIYSAQCYAPVYEVTSFTLPGTSDTYNINTRPTSITGGNYGIVGDNGQITKVEDNSTIINETNNTYYNPATGQTVPITGWSYDYSDRSYKVTMEGGKTSTVTYGDENISITETTVNESGDTITNNYTIYYLIDGSGSENPPAACDHDWQESSSTDSTCTLPGKITLSCTKCQQTKTESIPALGHNWQVKQTVTTQYDEEGNLTQQGYTIFECSRCHEQYKSTDGTIPPGGGSGTDPGGEEGETTIGGLIEKLLSGVGSIVGGIIKGLLSLLTKAVEALAGLAELFTTFVGSLVELWGGFTSFLSAVFPFLPEEFVIIIELGLILMIAAAVFRKFIS